MSSDLRELAENQIDLWFAYADTISLEDAASRYRRLLSPDEDDRFLRFFRDRDRHCYLLAHVMLRKSLSAYTGVPAAEWSFQFNEYGKPSLDGPVSTPLQFNLSHTRGAVACAIVRNRLIGVDIQVDPGANRIYEFAHRVFCPTEMEMLKQLDQRQRDQTSLLLWTLKEALSKAIGIGINLPFNQVSFRLPGSVAARIVEGPDSIDAAKWRFFCMRQRSDYCTSIAVEGAPDTQVPVRVVQLVGPELEPIVADLPANDADYWEL